MGCVTWINSHGYITKHNSVRRVYLFGGNKRRNWPRDSTCPQRGKNSTYRAMAINVDPGVDLFEMLLDAMLIKVKSSN